MALCEPGIAASMYAILMAIASIGTGIGLALAGTLVNVPTPGYRGALSSWPSATSSCWRSSHCSLASGIEDRSTRDWPETSVAMDVY